VHQLRVVDRGARELGVQRAEHRLALRVDQHVVDLGEGVVTRRPGGPPRLRQVLPGLEDLLDHRPPAAGGLGQPVQVALGVGQAVGVVDPQPVDRAGLDQPQHQVVRGAEDLRVLRAQPGEGVDREEPAVVEVAVGAPPVDQLVVLPVVHLLRGAVTGARCEGEAVVVVPQLPVDHLELLDVVGRPQHRDAHPPAAEVPVDVEGAGVGAVPAVLQHVPPPGRLGRVGDAHVVGHQVEHQAEPALVQRRDQPVEAGLAAARLVDVRVVDGVVAVRAARRRPQQRRGVGVADPEVGEVAGQGRGVVQGLVGRDLQPVGPGRDVAATLLAEWLGHAHDRRGALSTTIERSWSVSVSPGLSSLGSTASISAVSRTTVHEPAYSSDGRQKSIGSCEALKAR
jgi:hypothetical protein